MICHRLAQIYTLQFKKLQKQTFSEFFLFQIEIFISYSGPAVFGRVPS